MVAVTANSCTISISTKPITIKPKALATKAIVPGINSFWKQAVDASSPFFPASVSSFHALVICTAWETPIEKIRNGTRMDIGSIPRPKIGSRPSNQITGATAQTMPRPVIFHEPQYHRSKKVVITKANAKNFNTPPAPAAISPADFAKPIMCNVTLSLSYFCRISSRRFATTCTSRRLPVS